MKYEYKVVAFTAEIDQSDIDDGTAGTRVAGQLEALFEDYASQGWELQGQYAFNVNITAGCLNQLLGLIGMGGGDDATIAIDQLVFRKEV